MADVKVFAVLGLVGDKNLRQAMEDSYVIKSVGNILTEMMQEYVMKTGNTVSIKDHSEKIQEMDRLIATLIKEISDDRIDSVDRHNVALDEIGEKPDFQSYGIMH